MQSRQLLLILSCVSLLLAPAATSRADDVLQNLPPDAFGFVVVNNLAATDAKVQRLLKAVDAEFPGPLAFFQAATGIQDGLDPEGDALFAMLPGEADPLLAVWLPVRDYDRLIATLGGSADQKVAGITIAEEDVLVARHGRWAVVMDPQQRERIERILAAERGQRPALAEWSEWIDASDVTVVALPSGVLAALAWAASGPSAGAAPQQGDDAFGFGTDSRRRQPFVAVTGAPKSGHVSSTLRTQIRKLITSAPQLADLLVQARLVGGALRLDDDGNLLAGLRIQSADRIASEDDSPPLPPALYQGGGFVLHGAGRLQPALASIVAGAYVGTLIGELTTEEGMVLPDATVAQFEQAVERAAAEVQSAVVLTQPGDQQTGIYTNEFLVVRAASATAFADIARDVMRLWNSMNRDAEADTRLVFDVEEVQLGRRTATQYSLDIAAADGAPELPEIRQAMEKLFGPGGKLRLWIAPVNGETVLLATATADQVAAALDVLDRNQRVEWNQSDLAGVQSLLPASADWRVFFNPHHYINWHRHEMDAITGPVVGGPLVKEFPPAPPIGVAGGVKEAELRIDAAIPAGTMKSAAAYLQK